MSTGVPIVEMIENQQRLVAPYANSTSMTGTSGAIERGVIERGGVGAGAQVLYELGRCQVDHSADRFTAGPLEE